MRGVCAVRTRGRAEALIKALPELDIARNIGGPLDKIIQDVILVEVGNQPLTDCLIEPVQVMAGYPSIRFGGLISELVDKHLELGRIFVGTTLGSLSDCFSAIDDIHLAVRCQVLFLECLQEWIKQGERLDILVRVDVPDLCSVAEPGCSKSGLFIVGDLGEFHILLHSEHPRGNSGDGRICTVEFIRSGDLD